uniref:Fungal lipase-like domain-containing protein n=1 Tax=Parascaris equorum TaxID=6256 RepID=A0A914RUM2_PAREQ
MVVEDCLPGQSVDPIIAIVKEQLYSNAPKSRKFAVINTEKVVTTISISLFVAAPIEANFYMRIKTTVGMILVSRCRTMPPSQKWYITIQENTICDAHDSSCSGYTIRSDVARQYIVVFRGTKTKKQLLIEGWKSLKPGVDFYGIGKVNRYFSRALDTIWPNIEVLLQDADTRRGALASLAAMRTVLENLRNSHEVKLVTFGQPRVGDREFAMKHDELVPHSYRVVHRADIVPHLPACQKGDDDSERRDDKSKPCDTNGDGRAYHHGTEIWYPYGMKPGAEYFECLGQPKGEDFNCSDSLTFDLPEYDIYISTNLREAGMCGIDRRGGGK